MPNPDDRSRPEWRRKLLVWLTVAVPPALATLLAIVLQSGLLMFLGILWVVGVTAIALAYRPAPAVPATPARPVLPRQPGVDTGQISSAIVRVSAVKAEYGSLLSDIVYRIENSALFDDASPLTREFQLALIRWDDAQANGDPATLQRVSAEVELAFRTAKSHAEAVGLSHLPTTARPTAERALKAAHLAQGASTRSEREAALAQVARLLDSLALYYLPSPGDVPRLLGGARRELDD